MTGRRASFPAIGTRWEIAVSSPISSTGWQELQRAVHGRIEAFDKAYSRFRADSLVTEMARRAGSYQLPGDGFALLQFYEQLYEATQGKVTPLIGQVLADAGYDAAYSFKAKALRQPPRWQEVVSYDETTITVRAPVLLDFGAAGKGYLVDIVAGLLEQACITDYVINAGGDIRQRSSKGEALDVGLENPLDTSEAVGIVQLANKSLCASAGSKRAWGEFHHIIDPASLRSPRRVIASWVLAADTMMADGLATALFFTNAAELSRRFSFSYALLHDDMSLQTSKDFPVTVFQA